MDDPIDRLLHACGLRSFEYLRYPPVVIEEPTRSPPATEARDDEPEAPAPRVEAPVQAAPCAEAAEPVQPAMATAATPPPGVPAQVTFLNPTRSRPPAPPVLRQVEPERASVEPLPAGLGFRAAPVPARRFALLDEVAMGIAPSRAPAASRVARVSPPSTPSQPPPAPPRLRLRRRMRPSGES